MILPDFILPSRVNQHWQYSGMDSLAYCKDKKWFNQYPYKVEYHYNSRGFRDNEWPESLEELKNAIWCIGDSFTVGLGSPVEHTWPYILEQKTGIRTINVSMDGASNNWIARKTIDILQQIQPQYIVLHWSYLHRGESTDTRKPDEERRLEYDLNNLGDYASVSKLIKFVNQIESVKQNTKIIHSFIPNFGIDMEKSWYQIRDPSWLEFPKTLDEFNALDSSIIDEIDNDFKIKQLFEISYKLYQSTKYYIKPISVLDLARDGHHYGKLTAQQFAIDVRNLLHRIS